jgi:hypothetical protein
MFKLIQKTDPGHYYETRKDNFLVGKSKQCEIVIGDPHISDVQAKVKTTKSGTESNLCKWSKNRGKVFK